MTTKHGGYAKQKYVNCFMIQLINTKLFLKKCK